LRAPNPFDYLIFHEIPVETPNGTNKIFTLPSGNVYNSGQISVSLNGQILTHDDFDEISAGRQIVFKIGVPPPIAVDNIRFYYVRTTAASGSATKKKAYVILGSAISADTPVNISIFTNPAGITFGSSPTNWVTNYEVCLEGQVLLNGEDTSTSCNVYYVSSTEIAFKNDLDVGEVIQIIQTREN